MKQDSCVEIVDVSLATYLMNSYSESNKSLDKRGRQRGESKENDRSGDSVTGLQE